MIGQVILPALEVTDDAERVSAPFTLSPWLSRWGVLWNVTHLVGPSWTGFLWRLEMYVDVLDVWAPWHADWSTAPLVDNLGAKWVPFGDANPIYPSPETVLLPNAPLRIRTQGQGSPGTTSRIAYSGALLLHPETTVKVATPLVAAGG